MWEANDDEFGAAVNDGVVMVDFWGAGCTPCRAIEKTLRELEEDYGGIKFVGVNVEKCPVTTKKYGIRGLPTLLLFRDGKPVKQIVGLRPKAEILGMFKGVLL